MLTKVRRDIKDEYGVRLRDELKANYLLRPRGPLKDKGLGDGQRRDIYRRAMRALTTVSSAVFAVVIDKENMAGGDPFAIAWEHLIQQLMIRSESMGHPIVLVHDDGEGERVRMVHRHCREVGVTMGGGNAKADLLVEDPVPRRSELSYFIQAADLVAYAAFRRVHRRKKGPRRCATPTCGRR